MMLHVLMQGRQMGRLTMDGHGQPQFVYEADWVALPDAFPLSLSLPLHRDTHASATVAAVIWGPAARQRQHTARVGCTLPRFAA
ncbi:HipA N-terminal domain-containing protein [Stenotrophomonas sp.]|uniref:HipA N-terminal domain-containing protein n=1 Tax=Stenotrophomonas sp. TaxID=69392 RepID=UPI00289E344F|nr:HipA N-terminal domain-containing protein [Stenotrophomonas sp.]